MRDRLSKERRSWNMSRIRGKNTSPELTVRKLLHRMGYRFRLHVRIPILAGFKHGGHRDHGEHRAKPEGSTEFNKRSHRTQRAEGHSSLSGSHALPVSRSLRRLRWVRPDIVLPKYKTVIFVHGCFWHQHRGCRNCTTPTNRRKWWLAKLKGNAARDQQHRKALRKPGCPERTRSHLPTEGTFGYSPLRFLL